jgi:hypothetical protein
MESVRVQYVGDKPIKEDNIAATGVVWLGHGDVQDVPLSAWPRLAKHTGVWRLVEEAAVLKPLASATEAPAAVASVPTPHSAPATILLGANLPSLIDIGGVELQLGVIVAAVQEHSGKTVEAWNALLDSERQVIVEAFIEQARAEAAEQKVKDDAAKTGKVVATEVPKALSYEDLKDALTKAGVEFPKQAKKAVLQALYDEHAKAGA